MKPEFKAQFGICSKVSKPQRLNKIHFKHSNIPELVAQKLETIFSHHLTASNKNVELKLVAFKILSEAAWCCPNSRNSFNACVGSCWNTHLCSISTL